MLKKTIFILSFIALTGFSTISTAQAPPPPPGSHGASTSLPPSNDGGGGGAPIGSGVALLVSLGLMYGAYKMYRLSHVKEVNE